MKIKIYSKFKKFIGQINKNIEEIKKEKGNFDYYTGLSDFLYSGKRVLSLAFVSMGIYWLLYIYVNHVPIEMKQNELFNMGYMLAVLMIPVYYVFIYLAEALGDEKDDR